MDVIMSFKDRKKNIIILRKYLIKYLDCVPYEAKDKALSLIVDLDNELNWFKLQELKRNNKIQMSLFNGGRNEE